MPAKKKPKGKPMTPEVFRGKLAELDLPQRRVADVWGISEGLMSRWVNGKVPIPGWVKFALAGVPVLRDAQPKPVVATAPIEPAKPLEAAPPGVPGKWRFNKFYPD